MKDEPEPPVLPPATSSPPFTEAHAKTAMEIENLEGRLIVAAVEQDECMRGTGARHGTSRRRP